MPNAHAPPLYHLDADASSRRGQTVHQRRTVTNHHNDALTAHFQRLSMNKPRISSRFTYSERLSKSSKKGLTNPGFQSDSCNDLRMREKRSYTVSGVILARNGSKDLSLGLCNHEQRDVRTSTTLAKVHQCPGSLGFSSRSPRALSNYMLPVRHIHRRVTLLHYMLKKLHTFYFLIHMTLYTVYFLNH